MGDKNKKNRYLSILVIVGNFINKYKIVEDIWK